MVMSMMSTSLQRGFEVAMNVHEKKSHSRSKLKAMVKKNVQLAKGNKSIPACRRRISACKRTAFQFAKEKKSIPSVVVHLALAQTASSHEVLDVSSGSSADFIDSLQPGFPRI